MNCYVSGIFGVGLLGATYATMTVSEEQTNLLRKTFSPDLVDRYNAIVAERRSHYFQGVALGLLVSYFSLRLVRTTNMFHRIMFVAAVTLTITVVVYFLLPKSDYMLPHLKTEEEIKAWFDVYKLMKQRYFLGMLLGALAAVPIAHIMC